MPRRALSTLILINACILASTRLAHGGDEPRPPYFDPSRSIEERANDLVGRMTLEEKVSQMHDNAAAIPRLGIPAYP